MRSDQARPGPKKTEKRPGKKKPLVTYEYEFDYRNRMISYDGPDRIPGTGYFISPLVTERKPFGMKLDWRELLEYDPRHDEADRIRKTTRTGRPLGELVFARLAEKLTGRELVHRKRGWRKGRRRQG